MSYYHNLKIRFDKNKHHMPDISELSFWSTFVTYKGNAFFAPKDGYSARYFCEYPTDQENFTDQQAYDIVYEIACHYAAIHDDVKDRLNKSLAYYMWSLSRNQNVEQIQADIRDIEFAERATFLMFALFALAEQDINHMILMGKNPNTSREVTSEQFSNVSKPEEYEVGETTPISSFDFIR